MAAATQVLYASPYEGASVTLNYDDVTLQGTSLTIVVGALAHHPITYFYTISGVQHGGTVTINSNETIPINPPLQGVAGTDRTGGATIRWGIEPYGFSFS